MKAGVLLRTSRAFTLVEVMVALVITLLIIGAAGMAFRHTAYAMERSERTSRNNRLPAKVMELMERDLAGVYVRDDGKAPLALQGSANGNLRLSFFTTTNSRLTKEQSYRTQVEYQVAKATKNSWKLVRTETSVGSTGGSKTLTLLEDVSSIKVSCYNGKRWVSSWTELKDSPESIRIEIQADDGADSALNMTAIMRLP
jgi:prepilin-type N-terminal cleavage/methylation domain-containing protein